MVSTTVISARAPAMMNGPWAQVLQPAIKLPQTHEMDALYEAVAKRFLVVDAHGHATMALSIDGAPYIEVPGHGAENAAIDPTEAHVLRQRGCALLFALTEKVANAFAANGVPRDVALQQAQDIVLQLADKEFMAADEVLGAQLKGQQAHQCGIDVCIHGRQVSFHKTTTFVAKSPAAGSPAGESPAPTSLSAMIDVTVTFEAKPVHAWRHAIGQLVKCFGGDSHWLLEARPDRATVRQAPLADPTPEHKAHREAQLGVPPEPSGWRGAVAEWYRTLETIFGRHGMVFHVYDFGQGPPRATPAGVQLADVEDFVKRAESVSAAPRGALGRQRVADYRRQASNVWRDGASVHPRLADPADASRRREAVESAVKQIDTQGPISTPIHADIGRLAEGDFQTYQENGALHYQLAVPPSSCGYAARVLKGWTSEVSEDRTKSLERLFSVDLMRTLFSFGPDYLMLDGVRPVPDDFYAAHAALTELKKGVEYSFAQLPPAVQDLIKRDKLPGIDVNAPCTREALAAALTHQATETVRQTIVQTFADPDLQRQVVYLATQTLDLAMDTLATMYGLPMLPAAGEQRRCHITSASLQDGRPGCTVRYARVTKVEGGKHDPVVIGVGTSHVIEANTLTYGKVELVAHLEVTAATVKLPHARIAVDIVGT